jgi:ubiquinone/menaquinone biosynthesis C-methylase UbiE
MPGLKQSFDGATYAVTQAARVGRYLGESVLGAVAFNRRPSPEDRRRLPPPWEVLADLKTLFVRDWENIQAGLYRRPRENSLVDSVEFSRLSLKTFRDLFNVKRRQQRREVQKFSPGVPREEFPSYYAQNFHFQTDGYLSDDSADLYDHQVELVFGGGAAVMRRQMLVPLYHFFQSRPARECALLDLACGTGRFLASVKENYPELAVTGVDLSPWYLKKARERLADSTRVSFVEANGEKLPFVDANFDLVTNIYLFHELPSRVRRQVALEMFRVLRPGGLLVFEDSLQLGDKPRFDESLRLFPKSYHEPYYANYIEEDLPRLFADAGFTLESTELAFFSKILVLRKPL